MLSESKCASVLVPSVPVPPTLGVCQLSLSVSVVSKSMCVGVSVCIVVCHDSATLARSIRPTASVQPLAVALQSAASLLRGQRLPAEGDMARLDGQCLHVVFILSSIVLVAYMSPCSESACSVTRSVQFIYLNVLHLPVLSCCIAVISRYSQTRVSCHT